MSNVFYINTTVPSDVWTEFNFGRTSFNYRIINYDGSNNIQVSTDGTSNTIIDEVFHGETSLVMREWRSKVYCKAISGTAGVRVRAW